MRKIFLGLISIITIVVLFINIKLYSEDGTPVENRADIIRQLNFLEEELKNNCLGDRMQKIFPEGFVFTNVLYGLSWCELAVSNPRDKKLKSRAIREAQYALKEISSKKAMSTFDNHLVPENGIYYLGWKNYLLSKILLMDTTFAGYGEYKNTFKGQCDIIVETQEQNSHAYLKSYAGQAWPADMFVAMASVKNYDRIFDARYEIEIGRWLERVRYGLDPETKVIPHKVDTRTGEPVEGPRGSSLGLIIRVLSEIDASFAREQYRYYKQNFMTTTFGLPSIREYPRGQNGGGDVDSGPVIFAVGFSATIVSIGTSALLGDMELAQRQYQTTTAFGFSNTESDQKKYVFGFMPVADAFIAWGRASALNMKSLQKPVARDWRTKFHLISASILVILWLLFYYKSIVKTMKMKWTKGADLGKRTLLI